MFIFPLLTSAVHAQAPTKVDQERVEKGFQKYKEYREFVAGYSAEEMNAIRAKIIEAFPLPPGAILQTPPGERNVKQ